MSHTNYNAVSNKKTDENVPNLAAATPQPETTIVPEVAPAPEPVIGTVANCTKLNIRKNPNPNAQVICVIDKGAQVLIIPEESTEEWYKVDIGGQEGFCMKKYMTTNA